MDIKITKKNYYFYCSNRKWYSRLLDVSVRVVIILIIIIIIVVRIITLMIFFIFYDYHFMIDNIKIWVETRSFKPEKTKEDI